MFRMTSTVWPDDEIFEVDEDDTCTDSDRFLSMVADRGFSLEDFQAAEDEAADESWKDVNNVSGARATIGIAQAAAWQQAKVEIEFE